MEFDRAGNIDQRQKNALVEKRVPELSFAGGVQRQRVERTTTVEVRMTAGIVRLYYRDIIRMNHDL